jgi:peroxiredoxin
MRISLRTAFWVALVVVAAAVPAAAAGKNLDGRVPPEIRLMGGLNGITATTTLASLKGKVVCLKFWLTNCPICRGTLPAFQEVQDQYGRAGVVTLGLVIDKPEGVTPYVRQQGFTFGVGCDPSADSTKGYGIDRYPADYIIGIDGVVKASNRGWPKDVIEDELRRYRMAEWGAVPDSLRGARDAVGDGDYGAALKLAEAAAKAPGADDAVRGAATRLAGIAQQKLENRFARADASAKSGAVREARAQLQKALADFTGTSLEGRAKERLAAFDAQYPPPR